MKIKLNEINWDYTDPYRPYEFVYPEHLNTMGDLLGTQRFMTYVHLVEKNPRDGDKGNPEYYARIGARGELIGLDLFHKSGIKVEHPPLLAWNPQTSADIFWGSGPDGMKIDVKTTRTDSWDLLAKKKNHLNTRKKVTHYWFMQIIRLNEKMGYGEARCWMYSWEEVSKWKEKKLGQDGPGLYITVSKLPKEEEPDDPRAKYQLKIVTESMEKEVRPCFLELTDPWNI